MLHDFVSIFSLTWWSTDSVGQCGNFHALIAHGSLHLFSSGDWSASTIDPLVKTEGERDGLVQCGWMVLA